MTFTELFAIADRLDNQKEPPASNSLTKLKDAAESVGKAWSNSWLGYQSRVYYKDLQPVPPGTHFSKEWGFTNSYPIPGTQGEWAEYDFDSLVAEIHRMAGNPRLEKLEEKQKAARELFEESQARVLSLISKTSDGRDNDKFLQNLVQQIEKLTVFSPSDFSRALVPSGKLISRDMNAIQGRLSGAASHFSASKG